VPEPRMVKAGSGAVMTKRAASVTATAAAIRDRGIMQPAYSLAFGVAPMGSALFRAANLDGHGSLRTSRSCSVILILILFSPSSQRERGARNAGNAQRRLPLLSGKIKSRITIKSTRSDRPRRQTAATTRRAHRRYNGVQVGLATQFTERTATANLPPP
jgi:hypothetical protein